MSSVLGSYTNNQTIQKSMPSNFLNKTKDLLKASSTYVAVGMLAAVVFGGPIGIGVVAGLGIAAIALAALFYVAGNMKENRELKAKLANKEIELVDLSKKKSDTETKLNSYTNSYLTNPFGSGSSTENKVRGRRN